MFLQESTCKRSADWILPECQCPDYIHRHRESTHAMLCHHSCHWYTVLASDWTKQSFDASSVFGGRCSSYWRLSSATWTDSLTIWKEHRNNLRDLSSIVEFEAQQGLGVCDSIWMAVLDRHNGLMALESHAHRNGISQIEQPYQQGTRLIMRQLKRSCKSLTANIARCGSELCQTGVHPQNKHLSLNFMIAHQSWSWIWSLKF